jgi:hypothetical protein
LRLKVLAAVDRGVPRSEAVGTFGVSLATRALWEQLEGNDEATPERHRELWEEERGVRVSIATMSPAIRRLGWTRKKDRWVPPSGTKRPEAPGRSV